MKIKQLKLKNFAKFTDFEMEFDEKITRLIGVNGSGKTTLGLTAIWSCLKGIAEKSKDGQLVGERFRFIGKNGASSDIELRLFDEVQEVEIIVKNHITKDSNQISFEAPDNYPIDTQWLNNLLNVSFLSAKHFTSIDPKQQAMLLGIDTSEYDKKMAELKDEYRMINREYRNIGELKEIEKVEPVSIQEAISEREQVRQHNANLDELVLQKNKLDRDIEEIKGRIQNLQNELKQKWDHLKDIDNQLSEVDKIDIQPFDEKIANAEEINQKAQAYQEYQQKLKAKKKKEKELKGNSDQQKRVANDRLQYIQSFDFGYKGLGVDEHGKLLLDDRPIKEPYFSKGELELITARLCAAQNPEFKMRFIDNFEALDEENQTKILDSLLDQGFQVITSEIGTEATKDNTILLRECKQVDKYEPEENQKELL